MPISKPVDFHFSTGPDRNMHAYRPIKTCIKLTNKCQMQIATQTLTASFGRQFNLPAKCCRNYGSGKCAKLCKIFLGLSSPSVLEIVARNSEEILM